jgi:hypothetical protein
MLAKDFFSGMTRVIKFQKIKDDTKKHRNITSIKKETNTVNVNG